MSYDMDKLPIYQGLGLTNLEPDNDALLFVNDEGRCEHVTYAKLFENTNRMSHVLKKAGIGKGDKFVLVIRNHPELLYALFAAVSLGAIAVLVDPRSKGRKLSFQINNTKSKGIIVEDIFMDGILEIESDIPNVPVVGVCYKTHHNVPISDHFPVLNDVLENESPDFPNNVAPFDTNAPCQIIHTSGTTGDPKGVVLKADRFFAYGFLADLVWKYQADDIPYTGLSITHGNAQAVTLFPSLAKRIPAVISERFTKSKIWDICRKYNCTTFSLLGGMMAGIYN